MTVYIIENKINDKVYIGITSRTIEERFKSHLKKLNAGDHVGYCLYNAMAKYGKENFTIRVIDVANTWEELCEKEKMYIKKYDSMENGYNMTLGGEGTIGYKYTNEQRKKRSLNSQGKNNPNYGKSILRGKKYQDTSCWKNAAKKRWEDDDYRLIQSKNHFKFHSEETKKKISDASKKRGATYSRETVVDGVVYSSRKEACEKLGKTYIQLYYAGYCN